MKKITIFLMSMLLIFSLAACSNTNQNNSEPTQAANTSSQNQTSKPADTSEPDTMLPDDSSAEQTDPSDPAEPAEKKVLVVYYSATGSTEKVANYIAAATDADTFELELVNPYTSDDLNYSNSSSRVSREHDDPTLQDIELVKTAPDNWQEYDVVFLGYPIWWHAAAWPVNHFVTDNDFTGKTVIPFCTSASSPLEGSDEKLAAMTTTGDWQPGQRFSSSTSEQTVRDWVDGLGLQ